MNYILIGFRGDVTPGTVLGLVKALCEQGVEVPEASLHHEDSFVAVVGTDLAAQLGGPLTRALSMEMAAGGSPTVGNVYDLLQVINAKLGGPDVPVLLPSYISGLHEEAGKMNVKLEKALQAKPERPERTAKVRTLEKEGPGLIKTLAPTGATTGGAADSASQQSNTNTMQGNENNNGNAVGNGAQEEQQEQQPPAPPSEAPPSEAPPAEDTPPPSEG